MRKWGAQLIRYGGTAGAAAVVDVGLFALLHGLGVQLALAAALSFLAATVVNYVLTAFFVFRARPSVAGYGRFLAAAVLGFALNVGITVGAATLLGVPPLLAKITGIGIAFFFNFVLNVLFVFRDGPRADKTDG